MKLLVCVSKTPETTTKIELTGDSSALDTTSVKYIMNPYDEWYALVRALELKEAIGSGSVTILNVGPGDNDSVIRKGLAVGADDAIRVNAEGAGSLYIAKQIAAQAKEGAYDIIFFGKETIDYNGSEVGAMVAELLDIAYVSEGSNLEVEGNTAKITRDIEGGVEVVEVATPFAVSAAKGMAEQRIPNMRGIMMAKRKPLKVVEPVDATVATKVTQYELPPEKSAVKLIDPNDMEELVRLLHEEAKVI